MRLVVRLIRVLKGPWRRARLGRQRDQRACRGQVRCDDDRARDDRRAAGVGVGAVENQGGAAGRDECACSRV